MNVPTSLLGQRPKATDVSPWYGVYLGPGEGAQIDNAGSATLKVFHLLDPPS